MRWDKAAWLPRVPTLNAPGPSTKYPLGLRSTYGSSCLHSKMHSTSLSQFQHCSWNLATRGHITLQYFTCPITTSHWHSITCRFNIQHTPTFALMLLESTNGVLMLVGRRHLWNSPAHHQIVWLSSYWIQCFPGLVAKVNSLQSRSVKTVAERLHSWMFLLCYVLLTFSPKTSLLVAILGARTDSWVFCHHLCLSHDSRHCHAVPSVRAAVMQGTSIHSEMTNKHQIHFPCFCSTFNAFS